MTTLSSKRRSHTGDFKRDAVALVTDQGYKASEAAAQREPLAADGEGNFKKASQYFAKEMK